MFFLAKHSIMKQILIIFCLLTPLLAFAQLKIGDNPSSINASSVLELESTNKGFLLPRLSAPQMIAIQNPVTGLMIYNTTDNCIYVYRGNLGWKSTCDGSDLTAWKITGNNNITDNSFLGTTINKSLIFKTNNLQRGVLSADGYWGIGIANPAFKLDLFDTNNPLRIQGLKTGNAQDSLMSISNQGIVRYLKQSEIVANGLVVGQGLIKLGNKISLANPSTIVQSGNNVIFSSGFVGIGTSNPGYGLDVNTGSNPVRLRDLMLGAPSDFIVTDSAGILRHRPVSALIGASNGLSYLGNNVQLGGNLTKNTEIGLNAKNITLIGNGNIGIGEANPLYKLDLRDIENPFRIQGLKKGNAQDSVMTVNNQGIVRYLRTSDVIASGLTVGTGLSKVGNKVVYTGTVLNPNIIRQIGNNVVLKGGYLGVGTTDPQYTLDVNAALNPVRFQNLNLGDISDYIVTDSLGVLRHRPLSSVINSAVGAENGVSFLGGKMQLGGLLTKNTEIGLNAKNIALTGSGNIGLGIATPSYKLDVSDVENPLRLQGLKKGNAQDSVMTINNQGIVQYQRYADIIAHGLTVGSGLSKVGNKVVYTGAVLNPNIIRQIGNNVVLKGGNLGVGTTDPQYTLDVNAALNPVRIQALSLGDGADYIVTDSAGVLRHRTLASVISSGISANNGLSFTANKMQIGGALLQKTEIGLNTNDFTFTGNGKMGIGTNTPGYKLDLNDTANPLRLGGVLGGVAADSILTINNLGVVRKRTVSSMLLSSNAWLDGGNNLSGSGIFGTTSNQPLTIITNNVPRLNFATNGDITQGSSGGQVTFVGNVDAKKGLDVTGDLLTATGGSTLTGATNINTTGTSITTIGSATSPTNINGTATITGAIALKGATTINSLGGGATNIGNPLSTTTVTGNNLNIPNLPVSTTAASDDIVVVEPATGKTKKVTMATLGTNAVTANNGLTKTANNVQLGGALTQATNITTTATNNLAIKGLQAGVLTDDLVTANSVTGVLTKTNPNTFIQSNTWGLFGNTGTNANVHFLGTNDNVGVTIRTNNTARMAILGSGEVGIGLNTPTNKLHILATANPIRLEGLQNGANADQIMTVDATGVARKRTVADIMLTGNAWLNGGNNLTAPGIFGTTSNQPFSVMTNNVNILTFAANGNITQAVGGGQVTLTGNVDATNGLDVTNAVLTANAGSTLTGATNINTTGIATTNIGAAGGKTNLDGTTIVTGIANLNTTGTGTNNIGNAVSTTNVTGATNINTLGIETTSIGNATGTTNIKGATTLVGATNINTTGVATTTIGTALGTTNIAGTTSIVGTTNATGATNINTTGTATTKIGNATSPTAITGATSINTTGNGSTVIGTTTSATTVAGDNLTIPNLPISTTPSVDEVVVVDALTGKSKKVTMATIGTNSITADNGLTKNANNIKLGGALIQATNITTTAVNTLAITGLQAGANTDNITTSDATTGILTKTSPANFIQNNAWSLLGNTGTNAAIHFIGTKDNVALNIRTNDITHLTFANTGNITQGASAGQVLFTGNVDARNGLDVTNALLTASAGSTLTGVTNLNTTGTATTNIGNTTNSTNIAGDDLNVTNLPTSATPATDEVLVQNTVTGKTKKVTMATVGTHSITADNGLTKSANNIKLGGALIQATNLMTTAVNTLAITGLQAGANTDNITTSDATTGVLTKTSPANFIQNNAWSLLGNTGTNAAIHFIGTKDNVALNIRTNDITHLTFANTGNITQGASAGQVLFTGNVDATNGLDVTNALLTASAGATLTGITNINATGTAVTTIGAATGTTNVAGTTTLTGTNNVLGTNALTGATSINTTGTAATAIGSAAGTTTILGTTTATGVTNVNTTGAATTNIGNATNITNIAGNNLNIPNLPISTTPAIDEVVVVDATTGETKKVTMATVGTHSITADNGLTKSANNIKLGGALIQATNITTTAVNSLAITGLQAGASTDNITTSDATTGVLTKTNPATFIQNNAWSLLGNTGTNAAIHFIGTKDNVALNIRTNNITHLTFANTGTITQGASAGQVLFTGNIDATNGLDVTNALLTANAGSTLTGVTNINATGAAITNIGAASGTTNVAGTTIVTGATNLNTSGAAITTIGSVAGTTNVSGTTTLTGANNVLGTNTLTGSTSINTTGAATTAIGNATGTTNVAGTTTVTGVTNLNTTGTSTTNIGAVGGTTTILGTTTATGTTTLTGVTNLNTTGTATTTIGSPLGTTNVAGATTLTGATTVTGVTNLNTFGAAATSIGSVGGSTNVTGTTTVTGATNINTTGLGTSNIGNAASTTNIAADNLNLTNLPTSLTPATDEVLVQNTVTGKTKKVTMATIGANSITADNGLTKSANNIKLGGVLIQATNITTTAANTLAISGLQTGVVANNLVTADAVTGVLTQTTPADFVQNNAWSLVGNIGTNAATDFIGTKDNVALNIRTNDITHLTLAANGNITQGASAGQVTLTGNVDAINGLDVTNALLTANAGATITGTTNINATGSAITNIGASGATNNVTGSTNINTTGAAVTAIGSTTGITTVTGATTVLGLTNINNTGITNTNIGNASNTTSIRGTVNINTTGTTVTTIGGLLGTTNIAGTSTFTGATSVTGATTLNTTGAAATSIGNASNTTNIAANDLNLTNLPTSATPATDEILVQNTVTGKTKKVTMAVLGTNSITADNGLTKSANNIKLGGALTQVTNITTTVANTLAVSGLQAGAATDNVVTSDATTGVLTKTAPSAFVQNNAWALDGNTTTAIKKMGTKSNFDLPIITNDVEKMRILTNGNVGIATAVPNSTMQLNGSFSTAIRTVTAASTAAQKIIGTGDYTIVVNATAGTIALDLPDPATCAGRSYIIKKMDGINALTVTRALVLDLSTSLTSLTMASTYMIQSDGTQWLVVNRF
jgi:hypothetical protein